MKTIGTAIFAALAVVMIAMAAVPVSVSAEEISYVELGKDYKVQGGHGNGFKLFEMHTQLNASENLTFNWKNGIKGDGTNYWYVIIYTYHPALSWSDEWNDNNRDATFQLVSSTQAPPISLYVKPSTTGLVGVGIWTYGNFLDQTWNITVNRSAVSPEDYEQRISDLEDQVRDLTNELNDTKNLTALLGDRLDELNQTINNINSTMLSLQAQILSINTSLVDLELRVEGLEALEKQLELLNNLYVALKDNITRLEDFMNNLNITGDNVTVVYQNITKLYENITNLTNLTTENVTKTILLYQNTTKTINAYDNKTLQALANNLTKASNEISGLAQDLNETAMNAADRNELEALETAHGALKRNTVKKDELTTANNSAAVGTGLALLGVLAVVGTTQSGNKKRLKVHDDSISMLMETTKKPEPKKAAAKKVEPEKAQSEDIDQVLKKLESKKPLKSKTSDEELKDEEE